MEKIDLDLDNENEITFNVQIEGTRPGTPMCRLMIENSDLSYVLSGDFLENDEVSITVPPMKSILNEGIYDSYLEVIVDDRVFIPLEMKINFEKSVKVVAESINRRRKKPMSASASIVSANNNKAKRNSIDETEKVERTKVKSQKLKNKTISESDIVDLVNQLRNKMR